MNKEITFEATFTDKEIQKAWEIVKKNSEALLEDVVGLNLSMHMMIAGNLLAIIIMMIIDALKNVGHYKKGAEINIKEIINGFCDNALETFKTLELTSRNN